MAMSPEHSRALDRLRTQLALLTQSVASIRFQLQTTEPLPTWNAIQDSAKTLSYNMGEVMKLFESHAQLLKEAHAYPLSNFPGHTHEGMLGDLLRKKLEPDVENWISECTAKQHLGPQANGVGKHESTLKDEDLRELWSWASQTSRSIVFPMMDEDGAFDDNYTIAEREAGIENVVTGLKRDLDGDSEEDDEDEDDDPDEDGMEDVMPNDRAVVKKEAGIDPSLDPMRLENVLRFATIGALPNAGQSQR